MHCNRNSLLALLLATTLVAVQTALPWIHVGCEHDHSTAHAAVETAGHHHCRGHHHSHAHAHAAQPASDSAPAFDHRHEQQLAEDCAACRFLLLSSVPYEPAAICLIEQVSLLASPLPVAAVSSEPVGLYRSRAPPALS